MITDTTLAAPAASFDIQAIAQTYASLLLVLLLRSTSAITIENASMRFNNDSGANYHRQRLAGNDAVASAVATAAATEMGLFREMGATDGAGRFSTYWAFIPAYTGTTAEKVVLAVGASFQADVGAGFIAELAGGLWKSTAAIDRITVLPGTGSLAIGSRATLYGLT